MGYFGTAGYGLAQRPVSIRPSDAGHASVRCARRSTARTVAANSYGRPNDGPTGPEVLAVRHRRLEDNVDFGGRRRQEERLRRQVELLVVRLDGLRPRRR